VYGSARTDQCAACLNYIVGESQETHMYIGGGILGTLLVIALIFYLARRA